MRRIYTYILFLSLSIISNSCRYGKDYVTPPPDLPAPFSHKPAAVQLAEIYSYGVLKENYVDHEDDMKDTIINSGTPKEKYVYEKGFLAERRYVLFADRSYAINYYKRQSGILQSVAYWYWPGIVYYEGGEPGPLELKGTFTFQSLQGDSLREVTIYAPNQTSQIRYIFDKKGYVKQGWPLAINGESTGETYYSRNNQNNISQSRSSTSTTTYEYDDHLNPFFAMGRVGDLAIDTSPNNVTRSLTKYISGNNTYTSITTYKYTYRSNGYPKKVIVKNSDSPIVETLVYKYND